MNGVGFALFFLALVAVVWNLIHEQGRQVMPPDMVERDPCELPGCTNRWMWTYHGQLICDPHHERMIGATR